MLKRTLSIFLVTLTFTACDPATMQRVMDTASQLTEQPLTQQQIGQGLKEALTIGIQEGANKLAEEGGYYDSVYKILLPEEARKVTDKLQAIPGFSEVEATILEKINRGAEDAAKKAAPIFVDAIKQMTFQDATQILMGDKDAATQYLNKVTYQQLYQTFSPVIIESLDKFNAREYWGDIVRRYNKLPLVNQVDPNLEDYVTKQALTGLFDMVEKKELNIREDVSARTTDLLKRVFAQQDE